MASKLKAYVAIALLVVVATAIDDSVFHKEFSFIVGMLTGVTMAVILDWFAERDKFYRDYVSRRNRKRPDEESLG